MAGNGAPDKRLFVIDSDAGTDDAQAILMALGVPDVDVIAITCCHGNTDVERVCYNVLRILKVADRLDIPVYRGTEKPLLAGLSRGGYNFHGADGLGDVPDTDSPGLEQVKPEPASWELVRLARKYPGEITLVCLAPLTNVALALRLDHDFGKNLKECYIMGGNYLGEGNISETAEFNFFTDPESAKLVLEELGCPITMSCWELCIQMRFPWAVHEQLRSTATKKNTFLKSIQQYSVDHCRNKLQNEYETADEILLAMALNRTDIILEADCHHVTVETTGSVTRGQMVLLRRPKQTTPKTSTCAQPCGETGVRIVKKVNKDAYLEMLKAAVL